MKHVTSHPFIWYELMTTDPQAATRFYGEVVGWDAAPFTGAAGQPPATPYTILNAGGAPSAGIMEMPDMMRQSGAPPHWTGYVYVEDVEESVEKVNALGGRVYVQPTDIPGVGRFAVIADPQGATLNIMHPTSAERPPEPPPGTPGRCGWHELLTTDQAAAQAFYGDLFGWTKVRGHDMGPMGVYDIVAIEGHEAIGMFPKPEVMPRSAWNYYFVVADINAAAGRVAQAGGQVLMGPHEVPGGSWILQGQDPQGAIFALLQPASA
jgi:predicted enzyme related to lactoylglutathione lyase